MKKKRIIKTGKEIWILLAGIAITSVITSCGNDVQTETTTVEPTDHSESLAENPQGETAQETEHIQTAENGAEVLSQYRVQLSFCDLSGTQLLYEELETEGYHYFMTKGLKGLPGKMEGCLLTRQPMQSMTGMTFICMQRTKVWNRFSRSA